MGKGAFEMLLRSLENSKSKVCFISYCHGPLAPPSGGMIWQPQMQGGWEEGEGADGGTPGGGERDERDPSVLTLAVTEEGADLLASLHQGWWRTFDQPEGEAEQEEVATDMEAEGQETVGGNKFICPNGTCMCMFSRLQFSYENACLSDGPWESWISGSGACCSTLSLNKDLYLACK